MKWAAKEILITFDHQFVANDKEAVSFEIKASVAKTLVSYMNISRCSWGIY